MRKVGVVLDSAFDLIDEVKEGMNFEVARMNIVIDGASYIDGDDIQLEKVIEAAYAGKKVTTSQPSPEAYKVAFENLIAKGATEILVMVVSKALSGSYQSAVLASELVDVKVVLVDSMTSAQGGELLIAEVRDMILANEDVEIIKVELDRLVKKSTVLLSINDLGTLVRGGRMNKTQRFIGTLMKIKPILTVNDEGTIDLIDKVRTQTRVITYMIDKINESIEDIEKLHIRIGHIMCMETALEIKRRLVEKFNKARIVISNEITPVVAVHLGKGGYGVSWLS